MTEEKIKEVISIFADETKAPVIQNYAVYQRYTPVSAFYQNVQREGVRIA